MLTLTENASTIVKDIAEQIPDASGLRITSEAGDQPSFEVAPAPSAQPGDETVEQGGATVFLDPAASQVLEDKVLDASLDPSGGVQFALMAQG